MTNYEKLYRLCAGLPDGYRDQSRARLGNFVERMTLLEADRRLDLRLREYALLCPCADHHADGNLDECREAQPDMCYAGSRELLRG